MLKHQMYAAIFISNFSLQAVLRHEPDLRARPVALVDPELSKTEIIEVNATAETAGVAKGQTPAQAMARCGGLIIRARSRAAEKSATDVMLQSAYSFSPNIEATAIGVCTIDLKGLGLTTIAARNAWSKKIVKAMSFFNLEAGVGVAATPSLALLVAHAARPVAVVGVTEKFVADLPIAALTPPVEISRILQGWGIRHVGELLVLGRDSVIERLGPTASALFEAVALDAVRPLKLVSPPAEYSETMEFQHEVETVEPLLFVLRRFVEQLAQRLELAGYVVAEFQLQLDLASGAKYERSLKIPAPTARVEILFRMLQTRLENVRTDSPIVSLRLTATPARPEAHQFGLFESTLRNPNQFAETLARLAALCGADRVGTPSPVASHKPDLFQMRPPNFDAPTKHDAPRRQTIGPALRRFRPPRPAQVEFRENRPATIGGELFRGAVASSAGPYLSSGNWWDGGRWSREEWDIEINPGAVLRIFRTDEGCFVEGIYD